MNRQARGKTQKPKGNKRQQAKQQLVAEAKELEEKSHSSSAKHAKKKKQQQQPKVRKEKPQKPIFCVVCTDLIPAKVPFYACPTSDEHSQCLSCFGDYVSHCCSNYFSNKFPLTCPVGGCKELVPDFMIRSLLTLPPNSNDNLLERYTRMSLRAGLLKTAMNSKDEIAVVCARCDSYAEIYPDNYKARAIQLHRAMRAWQHKRERAKIEAQLKEAAERRHLHPQEEETKTVSLAPAPSNATPLPLPIVTPTPTPTPAPVPRATPAPVPSATPAPVPVVSVAASSDDLPPTIGQTQRQVSVERFVPADEIGLTSLFFTCKTDKCETSVCLRCNTLLSKQEQMNHSCVVNELEELYADVLDILADASVRTCPKCAARGRKDLACTHITCEHCQVRYCYVCGKVPADFGAHNQWNAERVPADEKCPMYLHYQYGGENFNENNGLYNGDGLKSLNRFHITLQKPLIEKLQAGVSGELWERLMKEKFPNGIWDQADLDLLVELEAKNAVYREKKRVERMEAEAKRLKEEEEKREREALLRAQLEQQMAERIARQKAQAQEKLEQRRLRRERGEAKDGDDDDDDPDSVNMLAFLRINSLEKRPEADADEKKSDNDNAQRPPSDPTTSSSAAAAPTPSPQQPQAVTATPAPTTPRSVPAPRNQ